MSVATIEEGESGFISLSKEDTGEPRIHGLITTGLGNECVTIDDPTLAGFFRIYEKFEYENGFADEAGDLRETAQEKYDARQEDHQYNIETSRPLDLMPGDEVQLVTIDDLVENLNIADIESGSDGATRITLGPKSLDWVDVENAISGIPSGIRDENFRESRASISVTEKAHVQDPAHFYSDISTITYRYKCISKHKATAANEPGVGTWAPYWELLDASEDIGDAEIKDWVSGLTYDAVYTDDAAGRRYPSYVYNTPIASAGTEDADDPLHATLDFAVPANVLSDTLNPRITLELSISVEDTTAEWVTGTAYVVGIYVSNIVNTDDDEADDYMVPSIYVCKADHTASSVNAPGTGTGAWESYWTLLTALVDLDLGRCGIKTVVAGNKVNGGYFPSTVLGSSIGLPEFDITDYVTAGITNTAEVFVMLQHEYSPTHTEYRAHPMFSVNATMKFYSRKATA